MDAPEDGVGNGNVEVGAGGAEIRIGYWLVLSVFFLTIVYQRF